MFPLELITAAVSFGIGLIGKIITMKMEMKHAEQKMLMAKAEIVKDVREFDTPNGWFSFTRRFIALALLLAILSPIWAPLVGAFFDLDLMVGVPQTTAETSTNFLFGLFSYDSKDSSVIYRSDITILPEYKHYFSAVMGLYFGSRR